MGNEYDKEYDKFSKKYTKEAYEKIEELGNTPVELQEIERAWIYYPMNHNIDDIFPDFWKVLFNVDGDITNPNNTAEEDAKIEAYQEAVGEKVLVSYLIPHYLHKKGITNFLIFEHYMRHDIEHYVVLILKDTKKKFNMYEYKSIQQINDLERD